MLRRENQSVEGVPRKRVTMKQFTVLLIATVLAAFVLKSGDSARGETLQSPVGGSSLSFFFKWTVPVLVT